jgi:hypothetical protein
MISVICTQCRARLEMDDAFAGGVCRCQYCGTIQTVPSLSKIKRQTSPIGSAPGAAPAVAPASPRPQASDAPAAEPSGLDALAEAVASSSGLGRGSLRSGGAASPPGAPADSAASPNAPAPTTTTTTAAAPVEYARPARQKKPPAWVLVAGAVIAALLLVALGGAIFSGRSVSTGPAPGPAIPPRTGPNGLGGNSTDGGTGSDGGDGGGVVVPAGPHFCGISLQGEPSVVYVLDRGAATKEMFDTLKEATYRSLESLKPNQKFAVIFWNNGGDDACYPEGGLANCRPSEIKAAQTKFSEVYAGGLAEPLDAVKIAAALKPSAMVIVTGKALEEEVVGPTLEAVGASHTKVHTVALRRDEDTTVQKRISESTGGQSRVVTRDELHAYSE